MDPSNEKPQTTGQNLLQDTAGASAGLASSIVCGGCGTVIADSEPYPFRCPRAGDDTDHVLRRVLDLSKVCLLYTSRCV